mgnify:CR=1 FL=1
MDLLLEDTWITAIVGGVLVTLLTVLWVFIRVRRARESARPRGIGAALAYCLDGDLSEARTILEGRIRLREGELIDSIIGLVAVLRAQGELQRARGILNRLVEPGQQAWVDALRIRLELDAGQTQVAADYVMECPRVPLGLGVAALARDGRWGEALRVYRHRTSRKTRSSRLEAELVAGAAAQAFSQGQEKAGRKALKRSLSLNEDALLPLVVGARFHPKESDRAELRERLRARWPWTMNDLGETISVGATSDVLQAARAEYDVGKTEKALATLRDRLDVHPMDWRVRQQYTDWVLEHGDSGAWRGELAELTTLLEKVLGAAVQGFCSHCGLAVAEPVIICPRCDSIGTVGWEPRNSELQPRYLDDPVGARMNTLFED